MKKSKIVVAAVAAGLIAVGSAIGAQADPVGPPTPRQLNGAGSDTTQDIMQDIAETTLVGGVKVLGSWHATPPGSFINVKPGCTNVARPTGSGAGRAALADSIVKADGTAGTGCFEWARSSSKSSSSTGGLTSADRVARQLTFVEFAFDDLGYAVSTGSNLGAALTKQDLIDIYHCNFGAGITAYIPQINSGTRASWLTYVGFTNTAHHTVAYLAANHPCIKDSVGGVPLEEHDGRPVDANSIVPYSVGKWLQQTTQQIADVHGSTILGSINGGLPSVPNPSFDGKREVYNVIPTTKETDPAYTAVFGTSGAICTNPDKITSNGFAINPDCGQLGIAANRTTLVP